VLGALLLAGTLAACDSAGILLGSPDGATDAGPRPDVPSGCGNGIIESGEACDDGNTASCDGCSSICRTEQALAIDERMPGASVTLGPTPCLNCPFTVEAWFRLDAHAAVAPIVHQHGLLEFAVHWDGYELTTPMGGGGSFWSLRLDPGAWHHAAAVCYQDEDTGNWWLTAFIDGYAPVAYDGWGGPSWTCPEPLHIGHLLWGTTSSPEKCTIDDVRLSSAALYDPDSAPFTPHRELSLRPDTVAFYDFDDASVGLVPDLSGNGYDAVIMSGSLVPDDCHLP
jgi:cysteine-rich repeat protein